METFIIIIIIVIIIIIIRHDNVIDLMIKNYG